MGKNIKARKKLSELYRKGVEVRFGPEGGKIAPGGEGHFKDSDGGLLPVPEEEVALWVQAPSPLQREMALREAQASRARALIAAKQDTDSGEYLTSMAFLADMSEETLIDYIVISEQEDRRNEATRDVLAMEEWKEIDAYRDAMRQFEEKQTPEDDPDYKALLELDEKFGKQVVDREKKLAETARDGLRMYQRPALEKRALTRRSEIVGSQAFMGEYERQMLYFAVRDAEDNQELFFDSPDEMADADQKIREKISEALGPFIDDGTEAKNLPRAVSGSDSSEPPSKPETSEVSTPEEVSA